MISLLETLFNADSIAVVGATKDVSKTGGVIFRNLIENGYGGRVYPVNPGYDAIGEVKCYPSITEIKEHVDIAVIALRSEKVEEAVRQCVKIGVDYAIIISGGFSETGPEGKRMEENIREVVRGTGTRIIGPNTVGLYLPYIKLNTALTPSDRVNFPGPGSVALVSQSGALGLLLMDEMSESGTGVSSFVNLGNRSDLDEVDLLEYYAKDPRTKSIMMYIESVADGRKFYNSLSMVSRTKPAVILKSGSTEESAKAAMLHTGAMLSNDALFSGVLKQAGAVRARSETELYDFSKALAYCNELRGDRIAVVTTAGGAGVVSTDLLTSDISGKRMRLAELSDDTRKHIRSVIVPFGSANNPVDITAEGSVDQYREILRTLTEDPGVDGIIAFALPQTARMDYSVVEAIADFTEKRPIVVGVIGSKLATGLLRKFEDAKIAAYPSIGRAVSSMKALWDYWKMRGDSND